MKREFYDDWHSALPEAAEQPFAYVRLLSSLEIGENTGNLDVEELVEARFFGDSCEIALFAENGDITAMKTLEDGNGQYLDAQESFPGHSKTVTMRQYVDYDKDGQAYICAVRMLSCREGV